MNRRDLLKLAFGAGAMALVPALPMLAQTPFAKPAVGKLVLDVSKFPGATLGDKLLAAYNALPEAGGTLVCSNFKGPQSTGGRTITVRKPTTIILSNSDIDLDGPRRGAPFIELRGPDCMLRATANTFKGSMEDLAADRYV